MKTNDLLTIATAALGTAALTVVAFWAGPTDAGNDANTPPPKIANARFISHGVELTLAPPEGRTFKAGEQPEFELKALNTTNQTASIAVCVSMTASAPANMISRAMPVPRVIWQQEQSLTLKPKETKALTLCANAKLPPGSVISVSLREQNQPTPFLHAGVTVLTFSTVERALPPSFAKNR